MTQFDLSKIPMEYRIRAMEEMAARRGLKLPPETKARVLAEEAGKRGLLVHNTFQEFVQEVNPTLLQFEHPHFVMPTIDKIVSGELKRVMVLWPTQYHKSELFSRLLPAYYLLKYWQRTVALASYSADLAWELSGEARDYFKRAGGHFKDGSLKASTRNWRTARRTNIPAGGMWATGLDGAALGRGYHLGVVDDPIDPLKVRSRAFLRRFALWWPAKWMRGRRPNGGLVFVMQRLAVDDPAAWLLEKEQEGGDAAHHWHILCYDEIKSNEPFGKWAGPRGFPETCTINPDPRKVGEVLSPKWRNDAEVRKMQAQSEPMVVKAQRQQRPMLPTGDFWPLKAFADRTFDSLPTDAINGGWDWDPAYTKDEENSASAGVYSFRSAGDKDKARVYIMDVDWDWLEFPEVITRISSKTGPHYVEKKASGKSIVQTLKTYNIVASEVDVLGDKLARASAAQPAVLNGRIYVHRLVYQKLLYGVGQGLLGVTADQLIEGGEGLDLNDAFVQAVWRHLDIASKKKRVKIGG
jgi:hypothetical protein